MLTTSIHEDFLKMFYCDLKDVELERSNKLNVFTMNITNNSFAYDQLVELLGNKLYHFTLSRNEVQNLKDSDQLNTLILKAKDKLREYKEKLEQEGGQNEGGELGELLLYCLLESHLKAPKILTKLEIKTSGQMYVNGADGVHLLKLNDRNYQLIFGESKLHKSLSSGITKAFASLATLLENKKNKTHFEVNLVNSQLVKETMDEDHYQQLKKILMPSAQEDETTLDHSFGIFLGFDLKITEEETAMQNEEFRKHVRERICEEIKEKIQSLNNEIKKSCFAGYSFYIYIIPFSNLGKNRLDIINQLTS